MAEFGTGFDCFDRKSRTLFSPLPPGAADNRRRPPGQGDGRRRLRQLPAREWWHFTLADEPFPRRRFDFPVTAPSLPPLRGPGMTAAGADRPPDTPQVSKSANTEDRVR